MTTTQKVVTMMQSFGSVPDDGAIYNGYDGDYREKAWAVTASQMARNTFNPIRNIIESMKIEPNPEKELIRLSIGDPTVFGNLKPADNVVAALQTAIADGKHNGYGPSTGFVEARKAVAEHVSCAGAEIDESDVILCSGCSCALDLCIAVIADPGQNILVPKPGFPLYQTLANGIGVATREYNLIPDEGWQVDLADLESTIDSRTAAIVVNNPSNPCGSVFDRDHLRAILAVAERHCVPIIADEIYEHFVFPDGPDYHPIASLTDTVPVLSCGGLTKRYLVPGWRLGWITVHDRANVFGAGGVRKGLQSLSQRIIGANTLVQGALPQILKSTPASFFASTIDVIRSNAELAFTRLSAVPGLRPVMPAGAMYMMVGLERRNFPGFADDLDLVSALISEQSVFCLPGKCFGVTDFFRVVLTVPSALLSEALGRIAVFCRAHYSPTRTTAWVDVHGREWRLADEDSGNSDCSSDSEESGIGGRPLKNTLQLTSDHGGVVLGGRSTMTLEKSSVQIAAVGKKKSVGARACC